MYNYEDLMFVALCFEQGVICRFSEAFNEVHGLKIG